MNVDRFYRYEKRFGKSKEEEKVIQLDAKKLQFQYAIDNFNISMNEMIGRPSISELVGKTIVEIRKLCPYLTDKELSEVKRLLDEYSRGLNIVRKNEKELDEARIESDSYARKLYTRYNTARDNEKSHLFELQEKEKNLEKIKEKNELGQQITADKISKLIYIDDFSKYAGKSKAELSKIFLRPDEEYLNALYKQLPEYMTLKKELKRAEKDLEKAKKTRKRFWISQIKLWESTRDEIGSAMKLFITEDATEMLKEKSKKIAYMD